MNPGNVLEVLWLCTRGAIYHFYVTITHQKQSMRHCKSSFVTKLQILSCSWIGINHLVPFSYLESVSRLECIPQNVTKCKWFLKIKSMIQCSTVILRISAWALIPLSKLRKGAYSRVGAYSKGALNQSITVYFCSILQIF